MLFSCSFIEHSMYVTLEVEHRFYKPVRETHAVVDVRKQILEFNTAGSRLGLLHVERSWQMRMYRTKNSYCF